MKYKDKKYWAPEFANYNNYDIPDYAHEYIDRAFERILFIDPEAKIVQIKTKFSDVRFYIRTTVTGMAAEICQELASIAEVRAANVIRWREETEVNQ